MSASRSGSTTRAASRKVAMAFIFRSGGDSVYRNQYDGWIVAYFQGKPVGRLDWRVYAKEFDIKMVEVDPAFRRQGVATALYRELFREQGITIKDLRPVARTQEGTAFRRGARLNPLQPMTRTHDINEAVDSYWASYMTEPDGTLCFTASERRMTLSELSRWDDFSSWVEFDRGELVGASHEDAHATLAPYRGPAWATRALRWVQHPDKIPPIVLVDGSAGRCVGDGRGRINVATAFNIPALEAIILNEDPDGPLCFTFTDYKLMR